MVKAFIPLSVFRLFPRREDLLPLTGNRQGVFHLAFAVTGMHADTMKNNRRIGSIEVFILQAPKLAAINRISKVSSKFSHVKFISTAARFLIRRKAHTDFAVLYFGVLHQIFHRADNGRNSGLIVCSQQSGAIGKHDVLSLVL